MLGLLLIVTAGVTFGLSNIEVLNNSIAPIASWLFIGGFVAAFLYSEKEARYMDNYELGAIAIPILLVLGKMYVPRIADVFNEYQPAAGVLLLAITLFAFYALGTNLTLEYLTAELGLGTVLFFAASVDYGLLNVSILQNQIGHINVWVTIFALIGAYIISDHSIGRMTTFEIGALGVGIGSFLAYSFVPKVQNWVSSHNPQSGVALLALITLSYWVIMNDGNILRT